MARKSNDQPSKAPPWMADKISMRAVADLVPYAKNARTHSTAQIAQIAASIREFGFTNPVLVDGAAGIIAGHGRVLAAKSIGLESVPVVELAHLTGAQKRAYVIADNQLALRAGWQMEMLAGELHGLNAEGFDLELLGFEAHELGELMSPVDDGDETTGATGGAGSLADRFGIPPFSVLNAREGWWQNRKRAWLALGIQSELGRGEGSATGGSPEPLARLNAGQQSIMGKRGGAGRPRRVADASG